MAPYQNSREFLWRLRHSHPAGRGVLKLRTRTFVNCSSVLLPAYSDDDALQRQKKWGYFCMANRMTEDRLTPNSYHEAWLVRCFLVAHFCCLCLRGFLGRRFTLCLLRSAKRLLYRPTRFALVSSTRPL